MPALVVFHTPPDAAATKYSLWLLGLTAKSTTRPSVFAGPMLRNISPPKVSDFHGSFLSESDSFLSVFFCLPCAWTERFWVVKENRNAIREILRRIVFMFGDFEPIKMKDFF